MKWASVVLVAALLTPAFALASAQRPACCRAMAGGGMACCPAGDDASSGLQLRSCSSSSDFAPAPSAARAEIPAAAIAATLSSSVAPPLDESSDPSFPALDPSDPPPRG
jgi:hypothetical protein